MLSMPAPTELPPDERPSQWPTQALMAAGLIAGALFSRSRMSTVALALAAGGVIARSFVGKGRPLPQEDLPLTHEVAVEPPPARLPLSLSLSAVSLPPGPLRQLGLCPLPWKPEMTSRLE
jgi:hypothetical protein